MDVNDMWEKYQKGKITREEFNQSEETKELLKNMEQERKQKREEFEKMLNERYGEEYERCECGKALDTITHPNPPIVGIKPVCADCWEKIAQRVLDEQKKMVDTGENPPRP